PGVAFLRDIALAKAPSVEGRRVVVVGGGDVAIDSARSAWRLNASEVHVVYRREAQDMPAHAEEIEAAKEEGIRFHFLVNPLAVLGQSAVTGVRLQRQALGEFDASGRRRPRAIPRSEFDLPCDVLIPAIGQYTDFDWLRDNRVETERAQRIKVGRALETTAPGIFAAGDCVSGPATVIGAVAQGNKVAMAVEAYLTTGKLEPIVYRPAAHEVARTVDPAEYAQARRASAGMLPTAWRAGGFVEVEMGFDEATAQAEAKRCLRCDLEEMESADQAAARTPDA
ncbi:MAG TPA: FAD-dependent oxidoreductase, partial [Candidatus Methylomirabilis sp.]|nr:FAD-dependent oxidoreductase [Candidatus Methylomirabilis sp.]